jgi:hypothetical protein
MDFNGFPVSVTFAAGTYTGNAVLSQPFIGGVPTFVGDVATPTNVNWNTVGNTFTAQGGGRITLTGFNVSSSAGDVFSADTGASITVGAMRFGNCHANAGDMLARNNATIVATSPYSIIGTRAIHCYTFNGGRIQNVNKLVTVAGATTVSSSLAAFMADVDSSQLLFGLEFSVAVTGRGALAQAGGILFVNGDTRWVPNGVNAYPGSVANVQQTGGLII